MDATLASPPAEGFKMPFDPEAERRKSQPKEKDTDTAYRAATFIETYTGLPFDFRAPNLDNINAIDIAHALSNQCRYSGHTRWHYSTAQHCCLLANFVAEKGGNALECLQILLHDGAEAYLVDIPRPVKQFMPVYREWDHSVQHAIRKKFNLDQFPMPSYQDDLDSRVIVDERAALMDEAQRNDWGHRMAPLGVQIVPWTPKEAEKNFLMLYAMFGKAVYGRDTYINHAWGIPYRVLHQTSSDVINGPVDVIEVDTIGGVAAVKVLDSAGLTMRDKEAGTFPAPKVKWVHGKFHVESAR